MERFINIHNNDFHNNKVEVFWPYLKYSIFPSIPSTCHKILFSTTYFPPYPAITYYTFNLKTIVIIASNVNNTKKITLF